MLQTSLVWLDVSDCSLSDASFISHLANSPLETLNLSGIRVKMREIFVAMSGLAMKRDVVMRRSIETLVITKCPSLAYEDISFALNHLLKLTCLDVTDTALTTSSLAIVQHDNPFLDLRTTSGFVGFELIDADKRRNYKQFWSKLRRLKQHRAANIFRSFRLKVIILFDASSVFVQ